MLHVYTIAKLIFSNIVMLESQDLLLRFYSNPLVLLRGYESVSFL